MKVDKIEIPGGWFVEDVDFDAQEPFIKIINDKNWDETRKLNVPHALAYYLSTHNNGSRKLREKILEQGRLEIINGIKKTLRLEAKNEN